MVDSLYVVLDLNVYVYHLGGKNESREKVAIVFGQEFVEV